MIDLEWDSRIFNGRTGRVENCSNIPLISSLSSYKFVHVRIPYHQIELVWAYEKIGFRYITHDITLSKAPSDTASFSHNAYHLVRIEKQLPTFEINGFNLDGSRLHIDPDLRTYINESFWDNTIRSHCSDFADFALCVVNQNNQLIGFASCFNREKDLDLFLFVIHPAHRQAGIGVMLLKVLEHEAYHQRKTLTTNVVAANIEALNFYIKHGFKVNDYDIIMHYSNPSYAHI